MEQNVKIFSPCTVIVKRLTDSKIKKLAGPDAFKKTNDKPDTLTLGEALDNLEQHADLVVGYESKIKVHKPTRPNTTKQFHCTLCESTFQTYSDRHHHYLKDHVDGVETIKTKPKVFTCSLCPEFFNIPEKRHDHYLLKHVKT